MAGALIKGPMVGVVAQNQISLPAKQIAAKDVAARATD